MDQRWTLFGVTEAFLENKASWLQEPRQLHSSSVRFFILAGKLVWHSREDYELSNLAFFQAVIGLERALRLHFRSESESLAGLFSRAVSERVVTDAVFSEIRPFSDLLGRQIQLLLGQEIEQRDATHCQVLSTLVPKLRNQFMHGTYLLAPDYLHLAIQMREISDRLRMPSPKDYWNIAAKRSRAEDGTRD